MAQTSAQLAEMLRQPQFRDLASEQAAATQQLKLAEAMRGADVKGGGMAGKMAIPDWTGLGEGLSKIAGGMERRKGTAALAKATAAQAEKAQLEAEYDRARQLEADERNVRRDERDTLNDMTSENEATMARAERHRALNERKLTRALTAKREAAKRKEGKRIDLADTEAGPFEVQTDAEGVTRRSDGTVVPDSAVDYYKWRDDERMANTAGSAKQTKENRRAADRLNTDVRRYSENLTKKNIPKAEANLADAEEVLAGYMTPDEKGNFKGIPGIGYGQNSPGMVGGALTFVEDVFEKGSPGARVRQAVQRVLNTEIKEQSGAAVTVHEMVRNRLGAGLDIFSSEENFRKAWPIIREGLDAAKTNLAAGYSPDVVSVYEGRQEGNPVYALDYIEQRREAGLGGLGESSVSEMSIDDKRKRLAELEALN